MAYVYMPQQLQYYDPLHLQNQTQPNVIQQIQANQQQQQAVLQQTAHPALSAQAAAAALYQQQQQHQTGGIQPLHQLLFGAQHASREVSAGIKRGSDEMLHTTQTQMLNNNLKQSELPKLDLEPHDAKKVRLDGPEDHGSTVPSRVIQIRDIPVDANETELCQLAAPFGKVTNVQVHKTQKQAYVEMADAGLAAACVNYHTSVPANIRGKQVFLQFSNLKELPAEQNGAAAAAIAAVNSAQMSGLESNEPRSVLHVHVENMTYPVTIEVLKQIFSRFGQVLKIIIFNKVNQFQALVQFSDPISAQTAKVSLEGQNIYNNCCTLKIEFSKLPSLNVRYNNEKSRDFTNPSLPAADVNGNTSPGLEAPSPVTVQSITHPANIQAASSQQIHHAHPGTNSVASTPQTNTLQLAAATAPQMALAQPHQIAAQPPQPQTQHAGFGAHSLNYMHAGVPQAFHQLPYHQVQLPQMPQVPGLPGFHGLPGLNHGLHSGLNLNHGVISGLSPAAASQMAANLAAIRLPGALPQTGSVILVSNLNEEKVNPDDLFTLFGVYGDVIRVKVLYNKKDNALLQYNEPAQAQLALTHLDKIKVWGKQIRVAPSKHPIVQMPTDLQADGAKLTKDYTNSPLHRYKKKGSKNYQNIYPPSATLHLSNIPPDVSGDLLKTEFAKYGKVMAFKFFEKDHKMALIQMETIDDAVMGLVGMHNFQLGETSHLRVSFSKSTIGAPPQILTPNLLMTHPPNITLITDQ